MVYIYIYISPQLQVVHSSVIGRNNHPLISVSSSTATDSHSSQYLIMAGMNRRPTYNRPRGGQGLRISQQMYVVMSEDELMIS